MAGSSKTALTLLDSLNERRVLDSLKDWTAGELGSSAILQVDVGEELENDDESDESFLLLNAESFPLEFFEEFDLEV